LSFYPGGAIESRGFGPIFIRIHFARIYVFSAQMQAKRKICQKFYYSKYIIWLKTFHAYFDRGVDFLAAQFSLEEIECN
jgi:hypothetical protein